MFTMRVWCCWRAHRGARGSRRLQMRATARPPGVHVLALVANFQLTWERVATCAWRFAPVTQQLSCCRRNLCSGRLSLCHIDWSTNSFAACLQWSDLGASHFCKHIGEITHSLGLIFTVWLYTKFNKTCGAKNMRLRRTRAKLHFYRNWGPKFTSGFWAGQVHRHRQIHIKTHCTPLHFVTLAFNYKQEVRFLAPWLINPCAVQKCHSFLTVSILFNKYSFWNCCQVNAHISHQMHFLWT